MKTSSTKIIKKITIFILTSMLLAGCAGKSQGAQEGSEEQDMTDQKVSGNDLSKDDSMVSLTDQITKLEDGLSAVNFSGEDGFQEFLDDGGADSDAGVMQYLAGKLLHGSALTGTDQKMFGCSTLLAKEADGNYLFGRNFDWENCEALVIRSQPKDEYASVSTVNMDFIPGSQALPEKTRILAALYAPLDGMNEKGLFISVNMIEDSASIDQDTGKPDITTTTAVRLLLNQADSVENALQLLGEYDMHASMGYMVHFAIADRTGISVAVEYVDNKMVVTDTNVVTNYYLAKGSKNGIGTEQSHTRFDLLQKTISEKSSMTQEDVRDALNSVSKHNFHDGETTEWSIVMDPVSDTLTYYHREQYDRKYIFQL